MHKVYDLLEESNTEESENNENDEEEEKYEMEETVEENQEKDEEVQEGCVAPPKFNERRSIIKKGWKKIRRKSNQDEKQNQDFTIYNFSLRIGPEGKIAILIIALNKNLI